MELLNRPVKLAGQRPIPAQAVVLPVANQSAGGRGGRGFPECTWKEEGLAAEPSSDSALCPEDIYTCDSLLVSQLFRFLFSSFGRPI
ncbi:hypothetical protein SRHO_G00335730 [Serrasalmus rhombeus]